MSPETYLLVISVLPPKIVRVTLNKSMSAILFPFSNNFFLTEILYPNSLWFTFCINIAIVRELRSHVISLYIIFNFVFYIFEPIFDCLKFSLKQTLVLFDIRYMQNSIWKHLQAIVNLHHSHSLAFSLQDLLKALMCHFLCLEVEVVSKQNVCLN
jgi:hypothetical protein